VVIPACWRTVISGEFDLRSAFGSYPGATWVDDLGLILDLDEAQLLPLRDARVRGLKMVKIECDDADTDRRWALFDKVLSNLPEIYGGWEATFFFVYVTVEKLCLDNLAQPASALLEFGSKAAREAPRR